MAAKLLNEDQRGVMASLHQPPKGARSVPMNQESQARFIAVLLFLLTVSAVVFAGFNFQAERKVTAPDDGVEWV